MIDQRDMLRCGIIMAGGAGERFWPLSRRNRPKQLLPLTDPGKCMLAEAVERLAPVVPAERICVVTSRHLVEAIRAAEVGVPPKNVIAEPCKRNTSGALAYATAYLMAGHPEAAPDTLSLAITTADHRIGDPNLFSRTIDTALRAAEQHNALVTCGLIPTRPETGFGYVQIAEGAQPIDGFEDDIAVYDVLAFCEKPGLERAGEFVAGGCHFWNSGMFFWKASTFLDELQHARPALAEVTQQMTGMMRNGDEAGVNRVFEQLEDISIDFALMEHARRVCVVRGTFPWADVGSWPSLQQGANMENEGNLLVGDPIVRDVSDSIVYNAVGAEDMAVAVIGVDGLAVVVTEDAVLVIPKDRAQDVRHVVKALKERGATQL